MNKFLLPAPEGYISINELANLLPSDKRVKLINKRKNVYNLMKRNECPKHKKINGRTFFLKESVDRFLGKGV